MPSLASSTTDRLLLVASRNPVKIKAAHAAAQRCFPKQTFSVHGACSTLTSCKCQLLELLGESSMAGIAAFPTTGTSGDNATCMLLQVWMCHLGSPTSLLVMTKHCRGGHRQFASILDLDLLALLALLAYVQ